MCIVHKGFRGFRAVSPASILAGNLISLKPAIPYDTIHSPLVAMFWWRAPSWRSEIKKLGNYLERFSNNRE
jgi:hypothetical protein